MSTPQPQPSGRCTIGIFGGSFNPPHISHVLACQFALSVWALDRILAIPSYMHPFEKKLEPFEHRFEMARIAFTHLAPWVEVSRIEQERGCVSYTIDTVRELNRRYPHAQLHLIIGSDIVEESAKWKDYDELLRLAPPLVVPRLASSADPALTGFFLPAVSSTEVRQRIRIGQDVGLMVPRQVLEYIQTHRLYQD